MANSFLVSIIKGIFCAWFLQCKFDSLDPELLNSQVSKYAKFVNQLEKGLPPNNIVPRLKEKVENMKDKVRCEFKTTFQKHEIETYK